MRRDEAPQLQAIPLFHVANHAEQKPVHQHHPDSADACSDPHRKSGKRHGKIVRHDAGRSERFDGNDRIGPHLALLDRLHHLGTQEPIRERWVVRGNSPCDYRAKQKNGDCDGDLWNSFPKNLWIGVSIESDDPDDFGFVP